MKRIKLLELYQQGQKEKRKKGQSKSNKRFKINPNGDVYLILTYYSKERISTRNIRTERIEEFSPDLFIIPKE